MACLSAIASDLCPASIYSVRADVLLTSHSYSGEERIDHETYRMELWLDRELVIQAILAHPTLLGGKQRESSLSW